MDYTKEVFREKGIEFARDQEFNGNRAAFVRPRDASGISLEFTQRAACMGAEIHRVEMRVSGHENEEVVRWVLLPPNPMATLTSRALLHTARDGAAHKPVQSR
jgi:hypothetical protein